MPQTNFVSQGLRIDQGLMQFDFKPSLAMSAKAFDTLDIDIRSFREPLKRSIQRVIAPSIGQNFVANGRPETWTPLAEDTLTVKAQSGNLNYDVGDILRRSGLLWKTMQQYNIWTVNEKQAAILSLPEKIWYGNIHQAGFGNTASAFKDPLKIPLDELNKSENKAYIPQRQFALLQTQDIDGIERVFEEWLNERIIARLGL